jgi:hypothetical protein
MIAYQVAQGWDDARYQASGSPISRQHGPAQPCHTALAVKISDLAGYLAAPTIELAERPCWFSSTGVWRRDSDPPGCCLNSGVSPLQTTTSFFLSRSRTHIYMSRDLAQLLAFSYMVVLPVKISVSSFPASSQSPEPPLLARREPPTKQMFRHHARS